MNKVASVVPCRLCGGQKGDVCFHKDGYTILRCRQCDLVYLDHVPRQESLRALYSAEYFRSSDKRLGYHDYQSLESSLMATFRVRLRQMAGFCPPGRLLEIGCAMGFFLRAAQEEGWSVQGIELSAHAAEVARRRFDLPVVTGRLRDAQFPAASFDAVAMWDLIEHAPEPVALMREAVRLLRPGGLIVLSTGDVESLVARLSGPRWHLYHLPEHLSFFSPVTIVQLLESAGLRVQQLRRDGAMYTLEYLAYRLKTVYPNSLTSLLFRALRKGRMGQWGVWLNLRDIMTVLAIKE